MTEFQFLLGTLITATRCGGDTAGVAVSIPLRYADNSVKKPILDASCGCFNSS